MANTNTSTDNNIVKVIILEIYAPQHIVALCILPRLKLMAYCSTTSIKHAVPRSPRLSNVTWLYLESAISTLSTTSLKLMQDASTLTYLYMDVPW